ncbi:hypothetical protein HNR29_006477 [Rhizobium leguminosarum]|nr:hypothetical protein [Rhizobium leguminosarum]
MNAISRRSLLAGGGLLLATGTAVANTPVHALAAKPQARSGNFKPIDMAMERAGRDGTVAGVVATAAGPDGMIYEGTFGQANTIAGTAMRADAVFWLLSMTKAFTATACMQLIEQGRIDPEDDAAKYLPEIANPMVLEGFDGDGQPRLRPAKRAIKVRHLLTHTSGYTYSIWSDALTRYEQVTGMADIASCQNGAFLAPLEFDPATAGSTASAWTGSESWWRLSATSRWRSIPRKHLRPARHDRFRPPDRQQAEGQRRHPPQQERGRRADTRTLRNATTAGILHGRRRRLQPATRLHGLPADAVERRLP